MSTQTEQNILALDEKLDILKTIQAEKLALEEKEKVIRDDIFTQLKKKKLNQYKNDFATVSYVTRKTVKVLDEEKLLTTLDAKYIDVIPEEIIPEHKKLNDKLFQEAKDGIKFDGIEVEEKEYPQIKLK